MHTLLLLLRAVLVEALECPPGLQVVWAHQHSQQLSWLGFELQTVWQQLMRTMHLLLLLLKSPARLDPAGKQDPTLWHVTSRKVLVVQ
jgi:hypothetical protein